MSKAKWKLTNETYEFIKGEVVYLFELYDIKEIPISGFELASKMGIILVPYSSLSEERMKEAYSTDSEGFFAERRGKEYIFFNDIDWRLEKQNWTILHEIGHIVLDHTGNSKVEEDEAEFFAKYAIAPPVLIDKIKARNYMDIKSCFTISEEAARYAYDYYCAWRYSFCRRNRLEPYEQKLSGLFAIHA